MTRNKKKHHPSERLKERKANRGTKPGTTYPLVVDGENVPMHDPTKDIKRKLRPRNPTPPARGGNG